MQQRHYECDIGRTDQQELGLSQDKYITTQLRNATKIMWCTKRESVSGRTARRFSRRYSRRLWPFSSVCAWLFVVCVACLFCLLVGRCSLISFRI